MWGKNLSSLKTLIAQMQAEAQLPIPFLINMLTALKGSQFYIYYLNYHIINHNITIKRAGAEHRSSHDLCFAIKSINL